MKSEPLSWIWLGGYFDANGSIGDYHRKRGRGWKHRIRLAGYDLAVLQELQVFLRQGSITPEEHPRGTYYRLEINSGMKVAEILQRLLPYLRVKKEFAEMWLRDHPYLIHQAPPTPRKT